MRNRRQQIVHQRRLHGLSPQLLLDVHVGDGGSPALEQHVDERAIAEVGWNATGRGVRLVDVAMLLELRQHVSNGGRRHTETAPVRDHLRRDRLAAIDVLAYQRRQETPRSFR